MAKKFDDDTIKAYVKWSENSDSEALHKAMWEHLGKYLKSDEKEDRIVQGRLIVTLYRSSVELGLRRK